MYVLSNQEMREADGHTIRVLGYPSLTLMENAGTALANEAEKMLPQGDIVCVCGGGNNGGDGFVCARLLAMRGRAVKVLCYAEKFSADCAHNRQRWLEMGGEIVTELPACGLIVDCLYGTGFHGSLEGKDALVAQEINKKREDGAKVLSADLPSGICGENGLAMGECVQADVTLCLGEYKLGAMLNDGITYAGEMKKVDIGIVLPRDQYAYVITNEVAKKVLPKRVRNSHKGSYGRAAILAGSIEYTGAAYLSMTACLRSGVGYTTLFVPQQILPYYILKAPEALLKSINEGGRYEFNEENLLPFMQYDSIAIGMGMGISSDVAACVRYLVTHYTGKLIIDADAINSLAAFEKDISGLWKQKTCDVLLTPHIKEFSRLTGESMEEIQRAGIEMPLRYAKEHGVCVLLKNAVSVISDGTRVALNVTGNSGQAKGGSGDVLSGLIVGLCASGVSVFDGASLGAFLAGRAAELAVLETSEYALTATDIVQKIGAAFLSL